ncbi:MULTISPECIES: hypothetical protein [Streptacidiphilus]|uniref:Uncharacterized protein n=1 Tax=Streptacidiphilus cavernicola TaxID=3342716 RepID=A0ABV6UGS7_9ACTN|nr:hypothetical protein [Streptacidiphilus jeojiense]
MTINAAEAAMIGASIGAAASIVTSTVTHISASRRERVARVWDRRAAVYDELVVIVRRVGRLRDAVLASGEFPTHGEALVADTLAVAARLGLYAPEHLVSAYSTSTEAMERWLCAWGEWHEQQETNARMTRVDPLWNAFVADVESSENADQRLMRLLRADAQGPVGAGRWAQVRVEPKRRRDRARGGPP